MSGKEMKKVSRLYKCLAWILKSVYPKIQVVGEENLPDEPAIIVGNHSQMHGPIACEFYIPREHYIWCAGEMMKLSEVPAYAYKDFWSKKPKLLRPLYKLASYIIAPLSVCVFNNAHTIGVYHDARVLSTFKKTVAKLEDGADIVIFPEYEEEYNNILYQFSDRFIDVAKLYYKRTGKEISFVPMYLAPKLKKMYYGKPIYFCAQNPIEDERERICADLIGKITELAVSLPEHTIVPYPNIPKRLYPSNVAKGAKK